MEALDTWEYTPPKETRRPHTSAEHRVSSNHTRAQLPVFESLVAIFVAKS